MTIANMVVSRIPSLGTHRLNLLGSIQCAALRSATELVRRVQVCDGSRLISLREQPELACALRDAFSKYVREQFDADPSLEQLEFDFGDELDPAIEHIAQELQINAVSWPHSFAMNIVRRNDQITVLCDDRSTRTYDEVAYHANLLPRH